MATLGIDAYVSPSFRDTAGRFARWSGHETLKKLVKASGEDTVRALRAATPVRTGKAQRGWRATYLLGEQEVRISNKVDYVRFLVEGTRPHEIRPRVKSVLAFLTGTGEQAFARRTWHPGTRPDDRLVRALADVPNRVRLLVGKAGVAIRRELSEG